MGAYAARCMAAHSGKCQMPHYMYMVRKMQNHSWKEIFFLAVEI